MTRVGIVTVLLTASLAGQHRVPPEFLYERIWATLPVVGTGKPGDPFRPMFLPNPAANLSLRRGQVPQRVDRTSALLATQVWFSDDGKTALVELVAEDRSAFAQILNSRLPGVRVFERGKTTKQEVEAEFKKYKRDFNIDAVSGGRAQ
jgi:hypothetical protein